MSLRLGVAEHAQEVEQLRQKLQEVELGTALSQADSNFLQRELEEKEADIGEIRGGMFLSGVKGNDV